MTNLANVEQNGILPAALRPAATEIMFCSAILHSRYWAGNFLANHSAWVEFFTSASRPTMRLSAAPSATSAAPYAFRGAIGLPAARCLVRPTLARGQVLVQPDHCQALLEGSDLDRLGFGSLGRRLRRRRFQLAVHLVVGDP